MYENKVLQELESLSPDSYLPQSLAKQRIEVAVEQQNNIQKVLLGLQ